MDVIFRSQQQKKRAHFRLLLNLHFFIEFI